MSQYRDDHAAARHRIEALEASLAEREAELAQRGAALAEREEQILHLERELDRAGVARPRRTDAAHGAVASRVVAASTAIVTAAMGLSAMRLSAQSATVPPSMFVQPMMAPISFGPTHPQASRAEPALIHADPIAQSSVDWAARPASAPAHAAASPYASRAEPRAPIDFKVWSPDSPAAQLDAYAAGRTAPAPPDENLIRRSLELKVRSGHATMDELRMLKTVCSHMGDKPCRDRAQAALLEREDDETR